jgi:hypothetical protein
MIYSGENCTVLDNYAACSGNSLTTFWEELPVHAAQKNAVFFCFAPEA